MSKTMKSRVARVCVLIAMALVLSPARPLAQSAYGSMGGATWQLNYYAEPYTYLMWNDARVEAWIYTDPQGAYWSQYEGWAWVEVYWPGEFCGEYHGTSNHWEIEGYQWYSIQQGYTDSFEVTGC